MFHTPSCLLHTRYWYLWLCVAGWYGDIHFLGFYFILIYALENIRYLMTYSLDVSNISTAIDYFGDIVENFCTKYSVT